jgi:hypothetical protein
MAHPALARSVGKSGEGVQPVRGNVDNPARSAAVLLICRPTNLFLE